MRAAAACKRAPVADDPYLQSYCAHEQKAHGSIVVANKNTVFAMLVSLAK